MRLCFFLILMSATIPSFAQIKGYPDGVSEVSYLSKADQTEQPALFWKPEKSDKPVPLLVALHTWSSDYKQAGGEAVYAEWCQLMGWAFVHPNFRGKNNTPEALSSDLAVADVLSSIDFAKNNATIDPDRIYCIGVSGGGHMSMMMAARAPEVWAGVSAWCGISDIVAWHKECSENKRFIGYAKHIEEAIGGPPDSSIEQLKSAQHRSPLTWLAKARNVNLDINHGVNDGREGSVPFTHSLNAWNEVVAEPERFSNDWIDTFYKTQTSPKPFSGNDPLFETRQPVFRKTSENGKTRITLFSGGHEIVHQVALNWLAAQQRDTPAVWELKETTLIDTDDKATRSGK